MGFEGNSDSEIKPRAVSHCFKLRVSGSVIIEPRSMPRGERPASSARGSVIGKNSPGCASTSVGTAWKPPVHDSTRARASASRSIIISL